MSSGILSWVDPIQAANAQRYLAASGYVILLYDIFITLDDEIKLIWTAPWSVAKGLFLINRYSVPSALFINEYMMAGLSAPKSDQFCAQFSLGLGIFQLIESVGVIPLMLLLRVYALYNRSRRVLGGLLLLACMGVTTCLTLVVYGMKQDESQIVYVPDLSMCSFKSTTAYLWAVWLLLNLYELTFESVILLLILFKARGHNQREIRLPLISSLLRDGIAYFGTMLLLLVICLVAYTAFPPDLGLVGIYFTWSLHSTLISRIYLNLRNVSNQSEWTVTTSIRERHASMVTRPLSDASRRQRMLSAVEEDGEVFELRHIRFDDMSMRHKDFSEY